VVSKDPTLLTSSEEKSDVDAANTSEMSRLESGIFTPIPTLLPK